MNYFNIQPIEISINNPFDFKNIVAIKWAAINVPRGSTEPSTFNCIMVDENQTDVYNWQIQVPTTVIETWLDDTVIDDYICSLDTRFVKI